MKIAIIGAGFSGLAVAWHLCAYAHCFPQLQIHVFDSRPIGSGTSGIAAGLLHPYTGAHAKLNWRGLEGFQETEKLLRISSQALGYPVTAHNPGILRLALTEEQKTDFQRCAQLYPQDAEWLEEAACQQLAPGSTKAPGLWLKKGITVYSALYLQGLWKACEKYPHIQFENKTISSLKELSDFDQTIITTGGETLQLPELCSLPLKLVKGQVLELSWPKTHPPITCALNSHVYIAMTETNTSCLVGATYEKTPQDFNPDIKTATEEILPKAYELFPPLKSSTLINCYAGVRVVAPQHRPFMQQISPSQWVLTGMGSKGLLYHALFAKELVKQLV